MDYLYVMRLHLSVVFSPESNSLSLLLPTLLLFLLLLPSTSSEFDVFVVFVVVVVVSPCPPSLLAVNPLFRFLGARCCIHAVSFFPAS